MSWLYFIYTAVLYGIAYDFFKSGFGVIVSWLINKYYFAKPKPVEPEDLRPQKKFKELADLKDL